MRRHLTIALSLVVAESVVGVSPCLGWEISEHRFLGDTVYFRLQSLDSILLDPNFLRGVIVDQQGDNQDLAATGWSFGQLCAHFAADDLAHNRFHVRGKTVLDQLRILDSSAITRAVNEILASSTFPRAQDISKSQFRAPRIQAKNAIGAYLLCHLAALRVAGRSQSVPDDPRDQLRHALVLESIAQGYLADAFSAGHLLVPLDDRFSSLHPRNNKETHNHYCTEGVYVINARGDVWQTFGDRLLRWFPYSLAAVVEACEYSLNEVMITYHVKENDPLPEGLQIWLSKIAPEVRADELVAAWLLDRDGAEYFDPVRMPTLMLIPMPVAASWSIRTATTDEHGIRRRQHFPQLADDGFHDPDVKGMDQEFLYPRSSVPDWLVPTQLQAGSQPGPSELIRSNPDWASVRWLQHRSVAPSFKGGLLHLGGQLLLDGDSPRMTESFGVGYGLFDDLIILRNISAELSVHGLSRENDPWVVALSVGGGFPFSSLGLIRALHIEGGPALVGNSGRESGRAMIAFGIDSAVLPLGFTQAGLTVRVKYVTLLGDDNQRGPALDLVLH